MTVSEVVSLVDRDTLVTLVEDDDFVAWRASAIAYMHDKKAPDGIVTGMKVLSPPKSLIVFFA